MSNVAERRQGAEKDTQREDEQDDAEPAEDEEQAATSLTAANSH